MYDPTAKSNANSLMTQTYAEYRQCLMELLNQGYDDPCRLRNTRPRRDDEPFRGHGLNFLEARLIIAPHFHLSTQYSQVLNKIVRKRVIVIDH
jgi:hypothetical protein